MNKILCIGDTHGSYLPIYNLYKHFKEKENPLSEDDVLICLGDFGANFFFNHKDYNYKKKLGYYKVTYFVIRGNHEQRPSICAEAAPELWHTEEFWGNTVYVENKFPYIKYALDVPAKYEIPIGQEKVLQTLVLPGAYSVDKYYRLANHWTWFSKEQLTQEEMDAGTQLASSQEWDLVLSHTCPLRYSPTDLFLPSIDQSTVDNTMEKWLNTIEDPLSYKLWLWGHYHNNRIYPEYNNSDRVMLSNDCYFDLYKYFYANYEAFNCMITINSWAIITRMGVNHEQEKI